MFERLFLKLMIQLRIKKVNPELIGQWTAEWVVEMLKLGLKNANYPERILIIEAFVKLHLKNEMEFLLRLAQQEVKPVADVCVKAIEQMDTDKTYQKQLEKVKAYWRLRAIKSKRRGGREGHLWVDKTERMQNLERLRKQLKVPIRMGR